MAGYKISSTTGLSRWISSIKSKSPASRLLSIAAKSPAFSSTGPDVDLSEAPISLAMMLARVVLPSPGGPKISVWSRASRRFFAASIKIDICSFTACWPMYSAKLAGRRARSNPASLRSCVAETNRSGSIATYYPLPMLRSTQVTNCSVSTAEVSLANACNAC